mmetsp:Transcript_36058/g.34119  ORF Transcript_36058/g.34119 Transcript_36058/m.34119 type:complete len:117 (-) Transcript_36058:50-400(-)|eukprot:CAMPEP_0119033808 /NCGR_PEP_ID=MMETSP1177-20130426/878_1 /TAXON_ID=2985 /ORGANISM="Ochromonas sp, Strain CCMP1899" /LENGTH=116 /DNA_ID=CAMNT_0006990849 /DNA_START=147 /DNA_END=497 /DNA_ORIENTATION=+
MTDQDQGDIFIDAKMSEYNASSNELLRAFMKELSNLWSADFGIDKESKQGLGVPLFDDCTFLAQKNENELVRLTQFEEGEKTYGGKSMPSSEKKKKVKKIKKKVIDVDKMGDYDDV